MDEILSSKAIFQKLKMIFLFFTYLNHQVLH